MTYYYTTNTTTATVNGNTTTADFITCPMDSIKGAIANAKTIAKTKGAEMLTCRVYVKDTNELVATETDRIW